MAWTVKNQSGVLGRELRYFNNLMHSYTIHKLVSYLLQINALKTFSGISSQ